MSSSLVERYVQACSDANVPPNSALMGCTANPSERMTMQELSQNKNFIGPRGLPALLIFLNSFRETLSTLDLSYNNLDNASIQQMALSFAKGGFSALCRLELRGNLLTYQGGKCLVHWCEGLKVVRPVQDIGDTYLGESNSNGRDTAIGATYWGEGVNVNIIYIGIQNNTMPLSLQSSLEQRIAAAVKRRERRRLRPSSQQADEMHGRHHVLGIVSEIIERPSDTCDSEPIDLAGAECAGAVAPDDHFTVGEPKLSARCSAAVSSSCGDREQSREELQPSISVDEAPFLENEPRQADGEAPAPLPASDACAVDVPEPLFTEDQPSWELGVEHDSVFPQYEAVRDSFDELRRESATIAPTDGGSDADGCSDTVPAWLEG